VQAQLAAQADEERSGRGRVIMLPTVVINADQYRGSLAAPAVLRALCAGFSEGRWGWVVGMLLLPLLARLASWILPPSACQLAATCLPPNTCLA
jgi:hypothetical protein